MSRYAERGAKVRRGESLLEAHCWEAHKELTDMRNHITKGPRQWKRGETISIGIKVSIYGCQCQKQGTHITIAHTYYSPVSAPFFGALLLPQRWSDRNKKHIDREWCACIFLSHYSKGIPENWEKTGKFSMEKCIENALTRQFWACWAQNSLEAS